MIIQKSNGYLADDEVLNYELDKKSEANLIRSILDVIFYLDFNKIHRTLQMENSLSNSSAIKILIDHHEEPDIDCDFLLSNSLFHQRLISL